MKLRLSLVLFGSALCSVVSQGAIVNFNYTQSDASTSMGTIAPFTIDGHVFPATALPSATVFSPGGVPPAGFVGSISTAAGAANEANTALGLLWSGAVTATATDGSTIQIPLRFAPKQTQSPDVSDYTWSVTYGDSPANGSDVVGTNQRFAMLFSRDSTVDNAETPNLFQRYTQLTQNLVAGQDTFVNTHTTTTAIKDATDAGNPAGTDAAGRDLAFYWAWRDGGNLGGGTLLVDEFSVSGLLVADEGTLVVVPEPSSIALGLAGALSLFLLRRRK